MSQKSGDSSSRVYDIDCSCADRRATIRAWTGGLNPGLTSCRRPHTHPVRQRARASRGAYCAPLGSKWLARNPAGFEQVEKRLYVRGSRLLALVAGRKTGHAGHPHARDCCGEDLRLGARERQAAPSRNLTTLWLCSPQGCSMNLAHCCIRCRRSAKASRRR